MSIKLPKKPLAPFFVPVTDIDEDRPKFINLAHAKKIDYCMVAGVQGAVPCIVLSDDESYAVFAKAEIATLAAAIGTTPDQLMQPRKQKK